MAQLLNTTPTEEIPKIVLRLRESFNSEKTKPQSFRQEQLQNLLKLVENSREEIFQALAQDLRKPEFESYVGEYLPVKKDIVEAIENLSEWLEPKSVEKPAALLLDTVQVIREPLGVVLIIGSWNFPFLLTLKLLAGAIAAGNCVVIKASEISVASSNLVARLVSKYLDPSCYQVINGGVDETTVLLKQKFDHILYTGNGTVGRIVMRAAAEQLTPVTLELGGKTPAVVDSNVDVAASARRLVWGKYMNAGQNCLAPDYILCLESVHDQLVSELKKAINEFYGPDASLSRDYGRIVSLRHFQRLKAILNAVPSTEKSHTIVCGGEMDESNLYIAPTLIDHVSFDSPAMKEELFGPILLVITIKTISEAINLIRSSHKPLAIYIFSQDANVIARFKTETSSGGLLVNDTLLHAGQPTLPFGGVGESGFGKYNAQASFETFSHGKAFLQRGFGNAKLDFLRFPPFEKSKTEWFIFAAEKSLTSRGARRLKRSVWLLFVVLVTICFVYLGFNLGKNSPRLIEEL